MAWFYKAIRSACRNRLVPGGMGRHGSESKKTETQTTEVRGIPHISSSISMVASHVCLQGTSPRCPNKAHRAAHDALSNLQKGTLECSICRAARWHLQNHE